MRGGRIRRAAGVTSLALVLLLAAAPSASALPKGTVVETYKDLINVPVDMAWPEGSRTIFFTEKSTGDIRVMRRGALAKQPCAHLDVDSAGEHGALGIALDPDWKNTRYLYVYFSKVDDNRVARFTVEHNRCVDKTILVRGIPTSQHHVGGQIELVDGYMFVSTGDAEDPALAQDTNSVAGKILRFNPDGTIPADNPFPAEGPPNAVWSYGHRNAFGLAHRPGTSQLFESENGPRCGDELNLIERGRNYGWGPDYPQVDCAGTPDGPDPTPPLREWTPIIAPTDLTWYVGRTEALSHRLILGAWADGRIRAIKVSEDGGDVLGTRRIHEAGTQIMDVHEGPGEWLYFLTRSSIERIVEESASGS